MSQTIALVDDDRNILTGISIALEREGFKVQTYIDGESALNGLTRNPPDLAVIDIKMPRMDGEELLKRVRKKMSIPIIFLTSKDEEVDQGTRIGMIRFGSRADLYFENYQPLVKVDQKTIAGETLIAKK